MHVFCMARFGLEVDLHSCSPVIELDRKRKMGLAAQVIYFSGTNQAETEYDISRDTPAAQDHYVMVVDDDPDARKLLGLMLKTVNLPFAEAENGFEALKQIFVRKPALILLDLMMPKMDGFQVLAQLRGNPKTRYVPVIVVTGMQDGWESLKLPGVNRVILKGQYTIPEMRKIVVTVLEEHGVKLQNEDT